MSLKMTLTGAHTSQTGQVCRRGARRENVSVSGCGGQSRGHPRAGPYRAEELLGVQALSGLLGLLVWLVLALWLQQLRTRWFPKQSTVQHS